MPSNYGIKEYRADLALAEARYTEVIRTFCVSNGAIIPLSDAEIYQAKATAMGHKSQMISAAGKRLRVGVALRLLDQLQGSVDLTATLATRITEQLLGRAIDRSLLLARYGTKNRTAGDKSQDFGRLEEIVASPVFVAAVAELTGVLAAAESTRAELKKQAMQGAPTEAQRLLLQSAKASE